VACFQLDGEGVLWFKNRLVVPMDLELRKQIFDEAHVSRYSNHPGSNKNVSRFETMVLVDKDETGDR